MRQGLKRKDHPYGYCFHCRKPLVLNEEDPIRGEGEQVIRYNVYCSVCDRAWIHAASKPGPWKLLIKKRGAVGLRCPACSEPVLIEEGYKSVICSCDAKVDRDGNATIKCDRCGVRHWSEKAIQFCEVYKAWYAEGKAPILEMPPDPAGTTDPGPWPLVDFKTIREAILRRDDFTCQDCGYSRKDRRRLRREREEAARAKTDGEPGYGLDREWEPGYGLDREYIKAFKETPEPPDFEVHHILPQKAGGLHNPVNLVTLCDLCHIKRHNLIGGFTPFPEVEVALRRPETSIEDRRLLLCGEHPIVVQARQERSYGSSTVKGKRTLDTRRRIREGRQGTLL